MIPDLKEFEVWFVTGSQNLYGEETLKQVADDSAKIAEYLDSSEDISCRVVFKPVVTTPEKIYNLCIEANADKKCVGLIMWMHTFSPAKMWIAGLNALKKPFVHLHTQFNRDIPWDKIDMDFMNLNQSAHGGREFGFICTRMKKNRKVVAGHWKEKQVARDLDTWMRAAVGWNQWQGMKIARFGDNMREVAVTEGDKVAAQEKFGYSVNGYAVGDLAAMVKNVTDSEIDEVTADYKKQYQVTGDINSDSIREAARIETGMRKFLKEGGFEAFTTTFEDLHGLKQLPGLAVQRLMKEGYGFGAEGDWKTAALVRAMKIMSSGLKGGTSFMEDYTYHLDPKNPMVLGAHMLEVCSSLAKEKPKLEVHPLGIGGKEDPARVVFETPAGNGVNTTLIDLGDHFRMIVNPCKVVELQNDMPNLPVARVMWKPKPDIKTAAAAWILAGGAHHFSFSMALDQKHMEDFTEMADIDLLTINEDTRIAELKNQIRFNNLYYGKK